MLHGNRPGAPISARRAGIGGACPILGGPFGGPGRSRCIQKLVEAGRRIGKYVLDGRIAVGGMAEVWAAHAEGREGFVKPVALKFILESFSGDPELERLFVNEARIAARLQHANLVAVFDFDKIDPDQERGLAGRYYIAMERVEGQDLRHISEAARRAGYVFPVGVALYVAGEVLKALRYVHEKREGGRAMDLVHRDVSPHNVLVGYGGEVKLSDFGIAKAREHSARTTQPGRLRGKIAYASPEQLGAGAVDHRTDQFAAAVTIWEILAGRRLFEGASDLEIIGKVARCEIPPLGAGGPRPDLPPAVESVLRRMLAAQPGDRFPTTAAALSAVLGLASYSPDGAPLGELVRTLFSAASPNLSQTLPLQVSALAPPRLPAAETRTMHAASVPAPALEGGAVTRHAKRTAEALARSPAAGAESSGAGGPTEDVRPARGAARVVGLFVVGLAIAGVVVARKQLWGAAEAPRAVVVRASPAVAPAPAAAPPAPAAAPPVPAAAPPVPAAPSTVPATPSTARSAPAASVAAPPSTEGSERHHPSHRHHAHDADGAPVLAAPPGEAKPSANGAPIIE
jgi:serine/threonine protein kinase